MPSRSRAGWVTVGGLAVTSGGVGSVHAQPARGIQVAGMHALEWHRSRAEILSHCSLRFAFAQYGTIARRPIDRLRFGFLQARPERAPEVVHVLFGRLCALTSQWPVSPVGVPKLPLQIR